MKEEKFLIETYHDIEDMVCLKFREDLDVIIAHVIGINLKEDVITYDLAIELEDGTYTTIKDVDSYFVGKVEIEEFDEDDEGI